ncbi:phosphoribosyltransferase [bacterium]|nr:phosphoribosyltransferase [bacterium]
MSDPQELRLFEECGALVRGSHLVYTSGRHGSEYVNKDALYPRTEVISALCAKMADAFVRDGVEAVFAPALGGIVLTQWTAHHLQAKTGKPVLALFAEKAETPEGFVVKRGYDALLRGKRTLVVEDILTTGGSIKKIVQLSAKMDIPVVGVAALCNRGGISAADLGVPRLVSIVEVSLQSWEAADCPLCKQGVPVNTKLGKGGSTQAPSAIR